MHKKLIPLVTMLGAIGVDLDFFNHDSYQTKKNTQTPEEAIRRKIEAEEKRKRKKEKRERDAFLRQYGKDACK